MIHFYMSDMISAEIRVESALTENSHVQKIDFFLNYDPINHEKVQINPQSKHLLYLIMAHTGR